MDVYIFKRKHLLWQYILGIFAVIAGVLALIRDIKGVVPLFIGGYLLIENGIAINFDNKTYRSFRSIFGITIGPWKPLPNIEYISVFKTTEVTTVWASSASTNVSRAVIKVNLFYDTNKKIEAYITKDTNTAFDRAKSIASKLNIDILDATTTESKWL